MEQDRWLYLLRSNFFTLDHDTQKLAYQFYRKLVYSDIYFRCRNHELTEDILQEVFLKVITNAPKATSINRAWIKQIARNHTYDLQIKLNKYLYTPNPHSVLNITPLTSSVTEQVEKKIRIEKLQKAFDELSELHRNVLFLYYFEEQTYKEIGTRIDKSEQALAQIMVRARRKLYNNFSRIWGDDW